MPSSPVAKKLKNVNPCGIPELGVMFPKVILPAKVDPKKWAIVACDQYTSEEEYWKRVEAFVGSAPSTLRLTFPEVYLDKGKDEEIIGGIVSSMASYEVEGIFEETKNNGVVLVERTLREGTLRRGIVLALDLEKYDYKQGSQTLIRATEKTIEARIPPRLAVRRKVSIELPHIIVLIDDPEDTVMNSVWDWAKEEHQIYETELMENSGHLRGFWMDAQDGLAVLTDRLEKLADLKNFQHKFGKHLSVLLFAMGDGNHSLATAKAHWEELKAAGADVESHPARFALVEIQNCHDPSLVFEPINRLVFGGAEALMADLKSWFEERGEGPVSVVEGLEAYEEVTKGGGVEGPIRHGVSFGYVIAGSCGSISIANSSKVLAVAAVTDFLDEWLTEHANSKIDYVHETTAIDRFCSQPQNAGFVFAPMPKADLFRTVILDGALPRKTFSMGASHDKRFYFEGRRIV